MSKYLLAVPMLASVLCLLDPVHAGPARTEPAVRPDGRGGKAAELAIDGTVFAVVLGPGPAWKRGQPFKGPGLDAHRRYWQRLHKDGRVASAGPLGNDTGLAVVRARNQREADALIANDPAVRSRILRGLARPHAAVLVSLPEQRGR